jgi:hypothetical protein
MFMYEALSDSTHDVIQLNALTGINHSENMSV